MQCDFHLNEGERSIPLAQLDEWATKELKPSLMIWARHLTSLGWDSGFFNLLMWKTGYWNPKNIMKHFEFRRKVSPSYILWVKEKSTIWKKCLRHMTLDCPPGTSNSAIFWKESNLKHPHRKNGTCSALQVTLGLLFGIMQAAGLGPGQGCRNPDLNLKWLPVLCSLVGVGKSPVKSDVILPVWLICLQRSCVYVLILICVMFYVL